MIEYILPVLLGIVSVMYYSLPLEVKIGDIIISSYLISALVVSLSVIFLLYLLNLIITSFFNVFAWYRKIIESTFPNKVIELVIRSKIGSKSITSIDETQFQDDRKFFISLIKFLLDLKISKSSLVNYSNGKFILAIAEFQRLIKEQRYREAIPIIQTVLNRYSITPFIYSNLRKCYIETKEYEKLHLLNSKVDMSFWEYIGQYGKNEGKILKLIQEYDASSNPDAKLSILAEIYQLSEEENEYTYRYFSLLQELNRHAEGINALQKMWNKNSSIVLAKIYYSLLKDKQPSEKYQYILKKNYPTSIANSYLLYKICFEVEDFDNALKYADEILKLNEVIGNTVLIEIYKRTNDVESLNKAIERLQEILIA